jgi:benzoate/toluate 1,2-dioxygenase alpha subunit
MSRGAKHWLKGPNDLATALGMDGVISSGIKNEDEGLFPVQHGYWLETLRAALPADNRSV